MVLAVPDEPARGRWGDSNRIAPGTAPVLRDEVAVVVAKQQYPRERLRQIDVIMTINYYLPGHTSIDDRKQNPLRGNVFYLIEFFRKVRCYLLYPRYQTAISARTISIVRCHRTDVPVEWIYQRVQLWSKLLHHAG
jgi:hypothetical protein